MNTNEEPFIAHGYSCLGLGGWEIQISNDGSSARIRSTTCGIIDEPTEWAEIEYDDEDNAFICTKYGKEYLNQYMRYDK